MSAPYDQLHAGQLPSVSVEKHDAKGKASGTTIIIREFNNNQGEVFTHERIKDYIKWFTKFGSFEREISATPHSTRVLKLKGLDTKSAEQIDFGHVFPPDSEDIHKLFDTYLVRAPDFYSKKIVKSGPLKKHPFINYDAVFCIEGNRVKRSYNKMLRWAGYSPPQGAYIVQERYGLWLCKDHIPIERKNEWITTKGSEFTKFHAFVNCQALSLTANRGSAANTRPEILEDLRNTVSEIYEEIVAGDDWREMEWLESEAQAYVTSEKERRDFQWRKERAQNANVADYKGVLLVEPTREIGVYALYVQLATLNPDLFPFEVVDYNTHSGIDVIVKTRDASPVADSALYYVEFKLFLDGTMNHCFDNMRAIVCWDTEIKNGERIQDLSGEERVMHVVAPDPPKYLHQGYFLRRDRKTDIEVYVLKHYLRDLLKLQFTPRPNPKS